MVELYHHGIKGQKWGVRRFQDYDGHRTAAGRERYGDRVRGIIEAAKDKHAMIRDIRDEKKAIDELYNERDIKDLAHCPRIEGESNPESNSKITNPGFPEGNTIMNCGPCSVAMAMREKGYDVIAAQPETTGFSEFGIQDLFTFQGSFQMTSSAQNAADLTNRFDSYGKGAYGIIGVEWQEGGGHFMFWKNESNGLTIYDGQDGTKYGSDIFDYVTANRTTISRLDNAEPKPRVLSVVRRRN